MSQLSPRDIAVLEERRQAECTVAAALVSEPVAGGFMSVSGPGSWTNQACGLGLAGPVAEAEVDRLVEFYASRGIEPKLEVCAFADETLLAALAARGFVLREFEAVLARPLTAGEAFAPALGWPAGITFARVDRKDRAQVEAFVEASTCGFRPEGAPVPEALADASRRMIAEARTECFLALDGAAAVGGGSLDVGEGVAALLGTSVRASHRGRGIQQALIALRLQAAQARGCAVVCIHSRPGIPTERNAARMGFALVYHKVALVRPGPGLEPSP
ncbi:GNAT family N-acetyltransferase [Nannocystis bainbridge]|uniref:GNAT family N-acetyltransferase n=1 Tax=Nannocystis bainbridge TaxID=2995303 RepID=A0ABT5DRV2_9BACT|nr:GNAT family N-acetyltransferase [Nannocystis bainbridge]MDC0716381.1 GNAT family N-acetyltransferase [Nannocystis bainbridge]